MKNFPFDYFIFFDQKRQINEGKIKSNLSGSQWEVNKLYDRDNDVYCY